jgi:SAM-dependent methyltransferase/uncharacterized protein YbaR (Trm112 family)
VRLTHFEALRPICPVCRGVAPLVIAQVIREEAGDLLEGILHCTSAECSREYPVIDGVPILVGPIRAWLSANPLQVLQRDDLSAEVESLLGDVLGAESQYDTTRQHVGIYAADHYEDRSAESVLDVALRHARAGEGPVLDAGCSVGGTTFALADRTGALTAGVDLNFAMLRVAARAQREGRVRYARRRVGLAYDRRELEVNRSDNAGFWCADVAALPFAEGTFAMTATINVMDCVSAPRETLQELARVTRGDVIVSTPYDWSPSATPVEGWMGGHSQRGPHRGESEPVLRALLEAAGLTIIAEEARVPWRVRLHERSSMDYAVHVVVARRTE